MAYRFICHFCGRGYTDEEGPHPYEYCITWLTGQINQHQGHLDTYNKRLEDVKRLVNEKGQLQ